MSYLKAVALQSEERRGKGRHNLNYPRIEIFEVYIDNVKVSWGGGGGLKAPAPLIEWLKPKGLMKSKIFQRILTK